MKILVVCQHYYPEPFRVSDMCEGLLKTGHEVFVVTGVPNYPEGKVYADYRNGKNRDEVINGVRVHRCFTIARRNGAIFRFLNYYSFAISSKRYVKKLKENFDVVLVNQLSPVMMANAGIAYKKKHGKKLVLYSLDLWPESLVAGGISQKSFLYRHYKKVSEKIYGQADKIFVTSKMFSDYFAAQFGITDTEYLPQYAEDMFLPDACKKTPDGNIDLMFAGNVGAVQSVETVIGAARLTQDIKNLRFHIVGDGSELDNIKKLAEGLKNVFFYGRKPVEEMPKIYSMADAMLLTLNDNRVLSYTLPGKAQAYMAAGKPIIGAIDGEAQTVLSDAKCGFCGKAGDADELADNIRKFIACENKAELAENARNYYLKNFAKERFFNRLISVLSDNAK